MTRADIANIQNIINRGGNLIKLHNGIHVKADPRFPNEELRKELEEDLNYWYEERSGVKQFEAEMTREEAEESAWAELKERIV